MSLDSVLGHTATTMARNTPDVKRVVSYVEIRPGMPAAAQPASLPPPGSDQGPASAQSQATPAAAPPTHVEVEKL